MRDPIKAKRPIPFFDRFGDNDGNSVLFNHEINMISSVNQGNRIYNCSCGAIAAKNRLKPRANITH
ncbi:hypothetical protein DESC_870130 [Desulfosarcina cetonica]|nr:hypothetical protein DESC_870130 [Desulfosarcina cetonica]